MRRGRWRGWIAALALVLVLAASIAAGLFFRIRSKLKGPPTPSCELPRLARGVFDASIQVSGPGTAGARLYDIEPMAALHPNGGLAIVYNPRDDFWSGTSGLATAFVDLAGKVEVKSYPNDRKEAFDAWMARGPDQKIRMVWLAHDGGDPERNMKVGYAESTDGRTWSAPGQAQAEGDCPKDGRGCFDKPMIAVGDDVVYGIYYGDQAQSLRVVTRPLEGGAFGQGVSTGLDAYGDIEVTPSGRVYIVSTGARPGATDPNRFGDPRNAVLLARSDDHGKSFSPPVSVSAEAEGIPFLFSNPQVRADAERGALYVVYPAGTPDGRWNIVLAISRDDGKTWTRVQVNDDAACANHMTPRSALDPKTGALHVTWLDNRSGQGVLAYAKCDFGAARCGPNEAVSDKPFASYTFERHLPAWLGEYGALVIDAERRILHAVWTQPVQEGDAAISRIFYGRARLP